MADDKTSPVQRSVESTIRIDFEQRLVVFTPKKVNGIVILDPVAAVVTMDQLIGVMCQILMADLEAKNVQAAAKVAPGTLLFPGPRG